MFNIDVQLTMMKPSQPKKTGMQTSNKQNSSDRSKVAEWRYGPAALWYDMLGVPESGEGFDYGFKLKDPEVIALSRFHCMSHQYY